MRRRSFLTALALMAGMAGSAVVLAQNSSGVPQRLLSRFKTGVNVTRWFCYGPPNDKAHFANYLNDQDFQAFKRLHVTFVRLCVSPEVIDRDGHLNDDNAGYVDAAIQRFANAGIATIFDLHDNGQLRLDQPGRDNSSFVGFWQEAARHYKGRFEQDVVFELLNEPQFPRNPEVWYKLQAATASAIRAIDPKRTIMVSGNQYSGADALAAMAPLPEKNLIYTFHCYDPFYFTHQGAEWVGAKPRTFVKVPFPSSPEAVAAILDANDPSNRGDLEWYGQQRYDDAYLQGRIALGMSFGVTHRVPVVLGEFGAYPRVSPPDSRARWFAGMRIATSKAQAPNALWGYDDALGLGRRVQADGVIWLDPVPLKNFFGQGS